MKKITIRWKLPPGCDSVRLRVWYNDEPEPLIDEVVKESFKAFHAQPGTFFWTAEPIIGMISYPTSKLNKFTIHQDNK